MATVRKPGRVSAADRIHGGLENLGQVLPAIAGRPGDNSGVEAAERRSDDGAWAGIGGVECIRVQATDYFRGSAPPANNPLHLPAGTIRIGQGTAALHLPTHYNAVGNAWGTSLHAASGAGSGWTAAASLPCGGTGDQVMRNRVAAAKIPNAGIGPPSTPAVTARTTPPLKVNRVIRTSNGVQVIGLQLTLSVTKNGFQRGTVVTIGQALAGVLPN